MESDKKIDRRVYMRTYYDENRTNMIKQIIEKQSVRRSIDNFIEQHRAKLIYDLNTGKIKFLQLTTSTRYNIIRDKKTLKYYHNVENDNIQDLTKIDEICDDEPAKIKLLENQPEVVVDDINLMEKQTDAIVDDNQDEQSDGLGESMSADMLKLILKQEIITDEDKSRTISYSKKQITEIK